MKYFFITIIATVVTNFSCKKTTTTLAENVIQIIEIPFNSCDNIRTDKIGIFSICYDSLVNDCRCPIGVQCIWAGLAIAKLSFLQDGNTVFFKLCTAGVTSNSTSVFPPNDTTINGLHIKLLDVLPYPNFSTNNKEIKKVILEIN